MSIYRPIFMQCAVGIIIALIGISACAPSATTNPQAPTLTAAGSNTSAAPSSASDAAVKVARVQGFGLFLTDNADRTLYAFANDTKDTSECTGTCLQNWPPFIAHATPKAASNLNATLLTTFAIADGSLQVEYDNHPLYYYAGDKNPGDVKGQGVGNVWHVLSPRGNPMMNAYSPGPTATP